MKKKIVVGLTVAIIAIVVASGLFIVWGAPPEGVYLGVYIAGVPPTMVLLETFERNIEHKVGIVMWFLGSDQDFPRVSCEEVARYGAIPHITWQPFPRGVENGGLLDAIISGRWDSYLQGWARDVKEYGGPVFLRLGHEFNGYWYPWSIPANENDPQKFARAWRHVHNIFKQNGATNVKWIWCPYHLSNPDEPWNNPLLAYPGDDYVDWIGIDVYNWGTSQDWSEWLPFRGLPLLVSSIRVYSTKYPNKPIMIAEFASTEEGGDKAEWIRDLLPSLKSLPQIKAIVWFNTDKETDWRVESSPQSMEAFKEIMRDPYFISGSAGLWSLSERYRPKENAWPTSSALEAIPFYVYSDHGSAANHFTPSGWMGDHGDIAMDDRWTGNPYSGSTCIKSEYSAVATLGKNWAGVYWQNPPNNWGIVDGGFNLSRATKLTFWARGENGGEVVQFKMGGIGGNYPDSTNATAGTIALTKQWQKYEIDLTGRDRSYISGGFVWVAKKEHNPQGCTFYLDEIRYE